MLLRMMDTLEAKQAVVLDLAQKLGESVNLEGIAPEELTRIWVALLAKQRARKPAQPAIEAT